jgi:hypothetical protein
MATAGALAFLDRTHALGRLVPQDELPHDPIDFPGIRGMSTKNRSREGRTAMKLKIVLGLLAACAALASYAEPAVAACDPVGDVKFICGPVNSEDLVQIPGTHWILAGGLAEGDHPMGRIYLLDAGDHSMKILLPGSVAYRQDTKTYPDCPGAPDEKNFSAHGLSIRHGANGHHTLYVVHHGGRESIEMFKIDAGKGEPRLTWVGCAVYPANSSGNSVAPLPGDGFAATSLFNPADPKFADKLFANEPMGATYTWHPKTGWEVVPASLPISGDNGVETSHDGKWLFIAGWADETLVRVSLGGKKQQRDVIKTGFHTDNLRFGPDGYLYAGGQADTAQNIFGCFGSKAEICTHPFTVLRVDPKTLKTKVVVQDKGSPAFGGGTTGLKVGAEYWIGTFRGDKIAIVPGK